MGRFVLGLACLAVALDCAAAALPVDDFDDGDRLNELKTGWVLIGSPATLATTSFDANPVADPTKDGRRVAVKARLQAETSEGGSWLSVTCGIPADTPRTWGVTLTYSAGEGVQPVVQAWTSQVQDHAQFEAVLPTTGAPRTVTVLWSEMQQPTWGRQVGALDAKALNGLAVALRGAPGTDACLSIDDVSLLTAPREGPAEAVEARAAPRAAPRGPFRRVPDRVELAAPMRLPIDWTLGLPVVDVSIDGQGPFPFVFDSGAEIPFVTPELASRLGLPRRGTGHVEGYGTESRVDLPLVALESVAMGGLEAEGLDVGVAALDAPGAERLCGAFGLSIARGLVVTLDGPGSELRISRGALVRGGAGVVPMGQGALPLVAVDVAGIDARCAIDSGANTLFDVTARQAERLELATRLRFVGWSANVDGRLRRHSMARMRRDVTIGTITLEQPVVGADARRCTLGSVLLRDVVTTFDAGSRLVRLSRDGGAIPSSPQKTRGFYERWECGRCVVADVLPLSAARSAALATGATIMSLDGTSVAELGVVGVRAVLGSDATVRVGLEDGRELAIAASVVVQ